MDARGLWGALGVMGAPSRRPHNNFHKSLTIIVNDFEQFVLYHKLSVCQGVMGGAQLPPVGASSSLLSLLEGTL